VKIRLDFVDFYGELDKENNIFVNNLRKVCEVEISSNPDLLFYGNYGYNHLKYNCFKIFYSAENIRPDFRFCDFSISFDYLKDDRNFRLPLYSIHLKEFSSFVKEKNLFATPKNKFCNFVYSNSKAKERIDFYNLLSNYNTIDSPGKVLNNMSNSISGVRYDYKSKLKFLSNNKFTIAFENESFPGYTTEKIIHPLLVGSIPIYWGNPLIKDEFDEKIFVNVNSYSNFEEVIEKVKEIDTDYSIYQKYSPNPDLFLNILNNYESGLTEFFKSVSEKMNNTNSNSSSFFNKTYRFKYFLLMKSNIISNKVENLFSKLK